MSADRAPELAAASTVGGAEDDSVGPAPGGGPENWPGSVDPTSPTGDSSEPPPEPSIAASARPNCHTTSDGALPGRVNCVVCAAAQSCFPTLYQPDHGWLATISPALLKNRLG